MKQFTTEKIYCYVDETGQDTAGILFIVSVIITQEDREEIMALLEKIEHRTGKMKTKWKKTDVKIKQKYIHEIVENSKFKNKIFYSRRASNDQYKKFAVKTISKAIKAVITDTNYKATILIDGLEKSEVNTMSVQLRQRNIHTDKVKGITDESHILIRLADAIAGFAREYIEGREYAIKLHSLGIKNETIREV